MYEVLASHVLHQYHIDYLVNVWIGTAHAGSNTHLYSNLVFKCVDNVQCPLMNKFYQTVHHNTTGDEMVILTFFLSWPRCSSVCCEWYLENYAIEPTRLLCYHGYGYGYEYGYGCRRCRCRRRYRYRYHHHYHYHYHYHSVQLNYILPMLVEARYPSNSLSLQT